MYTKTCEMGETIATAACGCIHLIRSVGCLARSIAKVHVFVGLLRVAVFLKYKKKYYTIIKGFFWLVRSPVVSFEWCLPRKCMTGEKFALCFCKRKYPGSSAQHDHWLISKITLFPFPQKSCRSPPGLKKRCVGGRTVLSCFIMTAAVNDGNMSLEGRWEVRSGNAIMWPHSKKTAGLCRFHQFVA